MAEMVNGVAAIPTSSQTTTEIMSRGRYFTALRLAFFDII
jgi:hypothetical protein